MKSSGFIIEAATCSGEAKDMMYDALKPCKKYLAEIGGVNNALVNMPLYRGVTGLTWGSYDSVRAINVLQNRNPLHTPSRIHTIIDDWFFNKFKVRFRSTSLFCISDQYAAEQYGSVAITVPAGAYNYAWSPFVSDLYEDLRQDTRKGFFIDATKEEVETILENCKYQVNTGLADAAKSGHEVMISCKKAVLINPTWVE